MHDVELTKYINSRYFFSFIMQLKNISQVEKAQMINFLHLFIVGTKKNTSIVPIFKIKNTTMNR